MATRLDPIEPLELTTIRDDIRPARVWSSTATAAIALALVALTLGVVAGVVSGHDALGPGRVLGPVVVGVWAVAAVYIAAHRPREPLAILVAFAAVAGALALLGAALISRITATDDVRHFGAFLRAFAVAFLPAVALHLALALPDGVLASRPRRIAMALGYLGAVVAGALMVADRPAIRLGPLVVLTSVAAVVGVVGYFARCRGARTAQDRARLQWVAWGVVVAVAVSITAVVLHELVAWPDSVRAVAIASTVLVPVALALSSSERMAVRIDRLLVHTITLAGLVVMVAGCYLLIVLGLGREPTGDEQTLLGLSMLAAGVAAVLWVPVRERITEVATRRVYGERHAPDEVLRTFGSRLTRALPLDELLLQLAESLKKTMTLDTAEVWTRSGARLERTVSVPERGHASIAIGGEAETVVARAGVSGAAWARIWLPAVLLGTDDEILRVAPITNTGELLGLIVVRRPDGALSFDEDDDQALTELARQVGLALHNVKLDSALQESLDEVRRQADELRASRARIVEAGDAQRRAIERDLHDGAQQHLVALAVNVNLARQLADADPETTKSMLEQIGHDLQDAVQELRNLAHGIYPPLLMDRGLHDALTAAASRAALPTEVEADDIGRYSPAIEAAIYFCCLEALQNAAKHAGAGAVATVTVREEEGALLFSVADDGAGFDLASGAQRGHGFVNMSDRVGAIGGSIVVEAAPGEGTTVHGRIPLSD
ncbi:MAG TPA: histidine kinase [Acidimicrobiia bacterium]|nr:histidine kinase [Acidimicrobiia bacterium]